MGALPENLQDVASPPQHFRENCERPAPPADAGRAGFGYTRLEEAGPPCNKDVNIDDAGETPNGVGLRRSVRCRGRARESSSVFPALLQPRPQADQPPPPASFAVASRFASM